MGSFRFYRRVHIFPGLSVNLSKSGPSLSVGVRGAHVAVGRRGVTRMVSEFFDSQVDSHGVGRM